MAALPGSWSLFFELSVSWHVWKIDSNTTAKVCDLTTATQWEKVTLSHPVVNDGLIYPDWRAIAQDWDAVHITIRTIAAIQGMRLRTSEGLLGPFVLGCRNDILAALELHFSVACGDRGIHEPLAKLSNSSCSARPQHAQVVAARLGHADPSTTMRVYAHVISDQLTEAADIFARAVAATT